MSTASLSQRDTATLQSRGQQQQHHPGRGSFYDVRAEGSIINIKHNQAGDSDMLIVGSSRDLKAEKRT